MKADKAINLALAAPLGYGLRTGASAVLNVLKTESGSALAVVGGPRSRTE